MCCSIWFSAPSLWMGGGLESRCVGRVYGADGAVRRTAPFAPMMGVCTRNMSSQEYVNKINLLHQGGITSYFMKKMHGQTTLKSLQHVLMRIGATANNVENNEVEFPLLDK